MKNNKNRAIALVIFIIGSTVPSINAAIDNLAIYNKAASEITVTMKIGSSNKKQVFKIPAGYEGQRTIANNQPIYLLIQEDPGYSKNFLFKILPTDKTKYVTFNPGKSPYLYPQTGPWMGLKGETESGLSLKNNIDKSYIQEGNMAQIID